MSRRRREFLTALAGGAVAGVAGCLGAAQEGEAPGVADADLTLTTTTSTYDTGLLDEVNAAFEDRFGATVRAVAQGTGAALETARNGDADVVLVHARSLEDQFLRDGVGINRRAVMFNDFVLVGPPDDPAGVDGMDSVTEAFQRIAEAEATFVSRGDDSGTHVAEREIWAEAGLDPGGEWYRLAGAGMGEVLTQADGAGAYTLSDRGTFVSMRSDLDLEIRVQGPIEGGPELLANPYGIIAVNPAVHDDVAYDLAMAYIGFFTGPRGQTIVEEYTVDGQQLFYPDALSEDPRFQQYVPRGWQADGGDDDG